MIKRFNAIFSNVQGLLDEYDQVTLLNTLREIFLRIDANETSIVVCGEFKRGKSTLINALLNQELCVTDEHIATSVVSIIKYGETELVRRIYETASGVQEESISKSDILKYSKGSDFEIGNTMMLVIETPNERLKSGLTIIDTPGVGGLNPRHKYLTLNALSKADAVFYMICEGEPVTTTELEFFKDNILPLAKACRIILNKADSLSEDQLQAAIGDCQIKFEKECELEKLDVTPVSAKLWEEYNASGNIDDKEFSYCEGIEKAIEDIREEHRTKLLLLLKNTLCQGLSNLRQVLDMQLEQLVDPNPEKLQKLISQRNLLKKLESDLKSSESEVRKQVASILRRSQSEVLSEVSKGNIFLSTDRLDEILKDDRALAEDGVQWVLNEVNKDFQNLLSKVDSMIEMGFDKAVALLEQKLVVAFDEFNAQMDNTLSLSAREDSEIMCALVRQALPGISVGGLGFGAVSVAGGLVSGIGSAIGGSSIGLLLGGVGAALSTLALPVAIVAGAAFIWNSIKDENRSRNIAELRKRITPKIQMMTTDMQTYVANKYEVFRVALEQHLESQASNLLTQLEKNQEEYQNCQKDSQLIMNKKKELTNKLNLLDTSITQLNVLLNNPFKK